MKTERLGFILHNLTFFVLGAIVLGLLIGHTFPPFVESIASFEVAKVNIPIALLIWVMIIPMFLKVDLYELRDVKKHWPGVSVTLFVNWIVKPLSMALLAWFFLKIVFYDYLPKDKVEEYIAGLILLAAAPCTAMVFVWSKLCKGDLHFTLSQVALNDIIMLFAFVPLCSFLLGINTIIVPMETLALSVILYIIAPLIIAKSLPSLAKALEPFSIYALLATIVLIFSFQGGQIISQPYIILLLTIPIVIQVFFNSGLAYILNKWAGSPHCVAGPSALIGASNFFELAVATAISLFGIDSGATLATVVGVLVEVPLMLLIVNLVNKSSHWYEHSR